MLLKAPTLYSEPQKKKKRYTLLQLLWKKRETRGWESLKLMWTVLAMSSEFQRMRKIYTQCLSLLVTKGHLLMTEKQTTNGRGSERWKRRVSLCAP